MADYPINRTPEHLRCFVSHCPAVMEDGDDLIIVGKDITKREAVEFGLSIGADEAVVRIPKAYFEGIVK